jgi:SAM-dependent methyltransferase
VSDLIARLREQEQAWDERPLVRQLYRDWYRALVERLSKVHGVSVELGSGIGRLRQVAGTRVVLTDVETTPWSDEVVDALHLPYTDESLANIIMLDVFHHLADPARFLNEVARTLAPGGRLLLIEPYCSPVSTPLYRGLHQEHTDMSVADPFAPDPEIARAAFDSNQALPTLVFYRRLAELHRRWPMLQVVERKRFASLLYPLSGGFTRRPLLPSPLAPVVRLIERVLQPVAPLLAFRCLVVLEKRD